MKAAFFDAGGTLVNIDYSRVLSIVKQSLGREVSTARVIEAEYVGRAAVEDAMAKGTAGTDSSRWGVHFRALLGELGLNDAEFAQVAPLILAEHRRSHLWSATAPGTAEALAGLAAAGWTVAVISNADGTVEALLESAGLRRHLRFVVDSGNVGIEKPDPRIFRVALEQAGVSAAESYYVGDIYEIDVVGAQGVGMVPVLLDPLGRYGSRGCRTTTDVPAFCRELVSATAEA